MDAVDAVDAVDDRVSCAYLTVAEGARSAFYHNLLARAKRMSKRDMASRRPTVVPSDMRDLVKAKLAESGVRVTYQVAEGGPGASRQAQEVGIFCDLGQEAGNWRTSQAYCPSTTAQCPHVVAGRPQRQRHRPDLITETTLPPLPATTLLAKLNADQPAVWRTTVVFTSWSQKPTVEASLSGLVGLVAATEPVQDSNTKGLYTYHAELEVMPAATPSVALQAAMQTQHAGLLSNYLGLRSLQPANRESITITMRVVDSAYASTTVQLRLPVDGGASGASGASGALEGEALEGGALS